MNSLDVGSEGSSGVSSKAGYETISEPGVLSSDRTVDLVPVPAPVRRGCGVVFVFLECVFGRVRDCDCDCGRVCVCGAVGLPLPPSSSSSSSSRSWVVPLVEPE